MTIYTYTVDHGKKDPAISAGTEINGGKLQAVMFDDGLAQLDDMREFLDKLRDETTCTQTKYAIDDFVS